MANSMASISVDAEGSPPVENPAELSITESTSQPTKRRRRWTFLLKDRDVTVPASGEREKYKFKALSINCSCNSSVKGSCIIAASSFIELIGNVVGLVYGMMYIQSALNFYTLGTDQELSNLENAQNYHAKLERVLFLEKNRVGFVGLLATCLVGIIVAFLMPIGTIYKSWKSLRSAMSLLFSICLAQIILTSIYLSNIELIASVAVVPFRFYEIFVISNYIRFYKQKKQEEAQFLAINSGASSSISIHKVCASSSPGCPTTLDKERLILAQTEQATGENGNVDMTLDLNDGNIIDYTGLDNPEVVNPTKPPKTKKKRRMFSKVWKQEKAAKVPLPSYDRYKEYDFK